jgi:hypothetical protein
VNARSTVPAWSCSANSTANTFGFPRDQFVVELIEELVRVEAAHRADDRLHVRVGKAPVQVGQALLDRAGRVPVRAVACAPTRTAKPRRSSSATPRASRRGTNEATGEAGETMPIVSPERSAGGRITVRR